MFQQILEGSDESCWKDGSVEVYLAMLFSFRHLRVEEGYKLDLNC